MKTVDDVLKELYLDNPKQTREENILIALVELVQARDRLWWYEDNAYRQSEMDDDD